MLRKLLLAIFLCGSSLATFSQSYQKVLKSTDLEFKYQKAIEYYQKGDYSKALPLLEELIRLYKGTRDVEDLYFYYADCQYQLDNFLLAAYHFKNLYNAYPSGKYAEESLFMHAMCYYHLSPRVELEQPDTKRAIDAFQLFINTFPNSEKIPECNRLMDILYRKLELKAIYAADLYMKMGHYLAAAVSYENVLKKFPATRDAAYVQFNILKAWYLYAINSVEEKKEERLHKAIEAYYTFIDKYSSSKFAKQAESIYESAVENLEKLKKHG